jgi:hypothetical protein
MTNRKNWLGMSIIVIAFGFALVGCKNNSINGTWLPTDPDGINYIFDNGNFEFSSDDNSFNMRGTYIIKGDQLTITTTYVNGKKLDEALVHDTRTITISDNQLTMTVEYDGKDVTEAFIRKQNKSTSSRNKGGSNNRLVDTIVNQVK